MAVPLAWKNLTHEVRRLVLALGGIGFAVLLMCMQLGFRNALFDSTVYLLRQLNADLIIVNKQKYTVSVLEPFSGRALILARDCPGVKATYPLYYETRMALWKMPRTKEAHPIRVLAFDPGDPVFKLPDVMAQAHKLIQPRTVLFDTKSKADYGNPPVETEAELAGKGMPVEGPELSGKRVHVVGKFKLGTDFSNDANLIMSAVSFREFFGKGQPGNELGNVEIGLVTVDRPDDPAAVSTVQQELTRLLPPDVKVITRDQWIHSELKFWNSATPVGFVFGLGAGMGFLVGVVICYQILFAEVTDHQAEFATLKAMGYRPRYFVGLVLRESLLVSLLGFVPGVSLSLVLYELLSRSTGLLMELNWQRAGFVLLLTAAMCVLSGCLTIRKLLSADPASLF